MQTVNNVNNDIDLSAGGMNNDINSSVASTSNIDSSVNSTNNDIQNIADVSTASERKTVDIDITTDQSSSGYVSKLTGFRFLDLEIVSAVVNSLCCQAVAQHAVKHHSVYQKISQGKRISFGYRMFFMLP